MTRKLLPAALLIAAFCAATTQAADDPKPAPKSVHQINQEMNDAQHEMQQAGTLDDILDPARKAEVGPRMIPPMKRMLTGFSDLAAANPVLSRQVEPMRYQYLSILSYLGDKDSADTLKQAAEGPDKDAAANARSAQLLSDWWTTSHDPAAQEKLLASAQTLAKENPANDTLAVTLMTMTQKGAATPELKARPQEIVMTTLTGQVAQQIKRQEETTRKMREIEGKPLTIAGKTIDGTQFTSADWKGKVVLVDFWATWCGPCMAELPRVKKIYADFHPKGLEIIGVSCDNNAQDLTQFRAKNPDAPWPQLFDPATAGWHPLATQYGVQGIPTMFLIDKKGVLRSVEARANMEDLIPKLLAEPADKGT